jgi:DNA-binding transcriptional ArsR family regulator
MSMPGAAQDPSPDAAPVPPEPPYGPLPVGSGRQVWSRRSADEAEAKALASPVRLRILRVTLHEPRTNKEIAEALGMNPASVLHHVRTLVDTGFLVEQPTRRGARGSRERPYLASGKSFYLEMGDAHLVGDQDLLLTTFLDEIKDLPPGLLQSSRVGLRLTAADRDRFIERIHAVLREIAAAPSDPDGESWSIYLGIHPEVGAGAVPVPGEAGDGPVEGAGEAAGDAGGAAGGAGRRTS